MFKATRIVGRGTRYPSGSGKGETLELLRRCLIIVERLTVLLTIALPIILLLEVTVVVLLQGPGVPGDWLQQLIQAFRAALKVLSQVTTIG
jgi:hypothetical protein